jgi:hypothetical protein
MQWLFHPDTFERAESMKDRIFKTERIVGKSPTLFWTLNYFTPQFLKRYQVKAEQ